MTPRKFRSVVCAGCGEAFMTNGSQAKWCPNCREKQYKEHSRLKHQKFKTLSKANAAMATLKRPKVSIEEIHRLASAAGMTYGQYTAMLEMQKEAKK